MKILKEKKNKDIKLKDNKEDRNKIRRQKKN